ncbi:hypothetical protein Y1Q_0008154 [Alligator mississippiensis]|uniref:Uncharacterized protein n=1 Tax=Alligator mississippiensis TaxID=8496 RepID=A0A151N167_ALLMI|nr:hypothetical protein Y1Q_0008154 [Alligator mississippiensis]
MRLLLDAHSSWAWLVEAMTEPALLSVSHGMIHRGKMEDNTNGEVELNSGSGPEIPLLLRAGLILIEQLLMNRGCCWLLVVVGSGWIEAAPSFWTGPHRRNSWRLFQAP